MAAGLGFKEFLTGDVLTAADANGYLASQVVMVFADSAARAAAITSPQEGMITFLKDTNSTEYYSGSAYVAIAGASGGMTLLSTTTLSGSSTAVTSIPGGYINLYCEIINFLPATDDARIYVRPNNISTASTYYNADTPTASGNLAFNDTTFTLSLGNDNVTASNLTEFTLFNYDSTATWKMISALSMNNAATNPTTTVSYRSLIGFMASTAAITSLTFHLSAGNFTSGTVLLYGVK